MPGRAKAGYRLLKAERQEYEDRLMAWKSCSLGEHMWYSRRRVASHLRDLNSAIERLELLPPAMQAQASYQAFTATSRRLRAHLQTYPAHTSRLPTEVWPLMLQWVEYATAWFHNEQKKIRNEDPTRAERDGEGRKRVEVSEGLDAVEDATENTTEDAANTGSALQEAAGSAHTVNSSRAKTDTVELSTPATLRSSRPEGLLTPPGSRKPGAKETPNHDDGNDDTEDKNHDRRPPGRRTRASTRVRWSTSSCESSDDASATPSKAPAQRHRPVARAAETTQSHDGTEENVAPTTSADSSPSSEKGAAALPHGTDVDTAALDESTTGDPESPADTDPPPPRVDAPGSRHGPMSLLEQREYTRRLLARPSQNGG